MRRDGVIDFYGADLMTPKGERQQPRASNLERARPMHIRSRSGASGGERAISCQSWLYLLCGIHHPGHCIAFDLPLRAHPGLLRGRWGGVSNTQSDGSHTGTLG